MLREKSEIRNIEEIFRQYRNRIYRLGISLSRNERDAEDILQNTFIKIIKNLKNFRHQSSLSTWIYRIAYNEALMLLRKRYSQFRVYGRLQRDVKSFPAGLLVNWSKIPDEELLNKELQSAISRSISSIPIKYRMALLLHNVEGLPVKESAEIMRIKIDSFKTRLYRAHRMVNSVISDYFQDHLGQEQVKSDKCSAELGFMYNLFDGKIKRAQQHSFKKHILDCPACKEFLRRYERAASVTRALECRDIPKELQLKLETFLKRHSQK